uniref:Uncharacterized protein n=1 Tax=Anguilla anguilla TaxID=7936 RepID=A0A0E9U436_ANGAN
MLFYSTHHNNSLHLFRDMIGTFQKGITWPSPAILLILSSLQ